MCAGRRAGAPIAKATLIKSTDKIAGNLCVFYKHLDFRPKYISRGDRIRIPFPGFIKHFYAALSPWKSSPGTGSLILPLLKVSP